MKNIMFISLFIALLWTPAQAQENPHNMVIEMNDGTKFNISPDDIRKITFTDGQFTVSGREVRGWMEEVMSKDDLEAMMKDCRSNIIEVFGKSDMTEELISQELNKSYEQLYSQDERLNSLASAMNDAAVEARLCPNDKHPHKINMGIAGNWSCCNVGASRPEELGDYYAWGESATKSYYALDTYNYYDSETGYEDIGDDIQYGENYEMANCDAAHVQWERSWRMPKKSNFDNLLKYCIYEWCEVNGVTGIKFTLPLGGTSIFFPAAGYRVYDDLRSVGEMGRYWTSTLYTPGPTQAYDVMMYNEGVKIPYNYRYFGFPIRPVAP